jgi:hypothetical protein
MNLAGGYNDIDEDGDTPETYDTAKTVQPTIDHSSAYACLTCPYSLLRKMFCPLNETALPSGVYGTIDPPPEMV